MMWSRLNKVAPIAVDVGSAHLRAAQIEKRNGHFVIRHWASGAVPGRAEPAPDGQKPDRVEDALPLNLLEAFAGREVVLAIGPPDVEFCALQVPDALLRGEHCNLIRGVRHEVGRHIRQPIDSVELDVWPLVAGHRDGCNVMAAAARRDSIDHLLRVMGTRGYSCSRIDLSPLATLRSCARMVDGFETEHLWGALDIGRSASRLYIGIGETPVYVRCLLSGGDAMTQRIADELGVDAATAERYKRHFGVAAPDGSYRPMAALTSDVDEERMACILLGVLQPILKGVAVEIEKSFRYAMALYPDRPVSGLILTGGSANLEGLSDVFGRMLGIRVQRIRTDRLVALRGDEPGLPDEAVPGMTTALGLGMGALA